MHARPGGRRVAGVAAKREPRHRPPCVLHQGPCTFRSKSIDTSLRMHSTQSPKKTPPRVKIPVMLIITRVLTLHSISIAQNKLDTENRRTQCAISGRSHGP